MPLKLAEENDYPSVLRMAKAFHEASPYSGLRFDEDQCNALYRQYLSGNKKDLIIILALDSQVFGMIIGVTSPLPFSLERVSTEVAWWVDEDHRGSRDSILLMKAYEDWSLRVGARMTQMAMLDESSDLEKFYLRSGYKSAERSFIKEI